MRTRLALIISLLVPLLVAAESGDGLQLPRGARRATERITEAVLRDVTAELASDAYAGRAPGSAGDVKARAWLEARMRALGLAAGAADGSYPECEGRGLRGSVHDPAAGGDPGDRPGSCDRLELAG